MYPVSSPCLLFEITVRYMTIDLIHALLQEPEYSQALRMLYLCPGCRPILDPSSKRPSVRNIRMDSGDTLKTEDAYYVSKQCSHAVLCLDDNPTTFLVLQEPI